MQTEGIPAMRMPFLFCTHPRVSINTSPAGVQIIIFRFLSLFYSAPVSILKELFSQGQNTSFQQTQFSIQQTLLNHPSDHYVCKLFWGFGRALRASASEQPFKMCAQLNSLHLNQYFKAQPSHPPSFLLPILRDGFQLKYRVGVYKPTASSKWMWIGMVMIHLHAFTFSLENILGRGLCTSHFT